MAALGRAAAAAALLDAAGAAYSTKDHPAGEYRVGRAMSFLDARGRENVDLAESRPSGFR